MNWKLLLLLVGIFISRFIFVSNDIPSGRITQHTETDQYYYTLPIQNQFIYESWYSDLPPQKESIRVLFDVFQNLWTATFFTLFGFNLISFKLAVISIFLLSVFLLHTTFSVHLQACVLIAFSLLYICDMIVTASWHHEGCLLHMRRSLQVTNCLHCQPRRLLGCNVTENIMKVRSSLC